MTNSSVLVNVSCWPLSVQSSQSKFNLVKHMVPCTLWERLLKIKYSKYET